MTYHPLDDQNPADVLDQLERQQARHAADRSIAHALRVAASRPRTRRAAIAQLDAMTAGLHRDVEIYRQRLLTERANGQAGRHLRAVPNLVDRASDAVGAGGGPA